jgi:hypothetical protein
MDWVLSGTVIHYNRYVEPQEGIMSVLLSSRQEAVACVQCMQKVIVEKGKCLPAAQIKNASFSNWKTPSSAKNYANLLVKFSDNQANIQQRNLGPQCCV